MSRQAIRIAIGQFPDLTEEMLRFAAQIGATGLQMNVPNLPGDTHWEEADIRALVEKTKAAGLAFEAIENVPTHFYNKIMLGVEGRDEQIENYIKTVRNVGRAGVPVLGMHFMANSVWRTNWSAPGRGGARNTKFDMALIEGRNKAQLAAYMVSTLGRAGSMPLFDNDDGIISADMMWSNYTYFMDAVLPEAEAAGVRIALHPDDPPVPILGGVSRIFGRFADFTRAYERYSHSPAWGLDLCLGCCSEMPGGAANVKEMIEYFGPKGRIFYVHFRDVQGSLPNFIECFIGEGNYNPAEVMLLLQRNGFDGFLLDDHVPKMDGDSVWNHTGRAHAIGYMQGLIRMSEFATCLS